MIVFLHVFKISRENEIQTKMKPSNGASKEAWGCFSRVEERLVRRKSTIGTRKKQPKTSDLARIKKRRKHSA
jgi:hypothetical protein